MHYTIFHSLKTSSLTKFLVGFILLLPFQLFCQLTLTVDNDYHRYKLGDTITFSVLSTTLDTIEYEITRNRYLDDLADGTLILQPNTAQEIKYIPSEPGNYFCAVESDNGIVTTGAVCDIRNITPIEPIPSDFEVYWDNIRTKLDAVPFNLNVELDSNYLSDYSTTYRISLGNIDQHRLYGYMTIPKTSGPFTGLVKFPPFGNSNAVHPDLNMAERLGAIVISISAHNSPVDVDLPQDAQYVPDIGLTDTVFYRWAMAGGMRAIDYIYSRTDFDGEHIGVFGNSQGAGLALLFAGIDDRVDLLIANNPIMSQHNGLPNNKPSGFPTYVRDHLNDPINLNRILSAVRYYDAVHAAQIYEGPALISVSLLDEVSPAETSYCSLNQLHGQLIHIHNLEGHHSESPSEFWDAKFDLVRRFFPTDQSSWPWTPTTTGYIANAGADTIVNCLSANIEGSIKANDITNPTDIAIRWELVDGPGTVVFDTPNNHFTAATFSQPGEYILRFSGEETSHLLTTSVYQTIQDIVKITVCPNNNCQPLSIATQAQDLTTDCENFSSELSLWLANHGNAVLTNSQPDVNWSHNFTQLPTGCNPSTTVQFTVSNSCGLKDSTTALLSVLDTVPPHFLAQAQDTIVYCDGAGNMDALDLWLAQNAGAIAQDNCQNITWTNDFSELGSGCNPTTLVTFVATDGCGLKDSTSATFMILDTTPPTISAIPDTLHVACNTTGNYPEVIDWLNNLGGAEATDNCNSISWTNNFDMIDCNDSIKTIQFVATDKCNNSTTTFGIISVTNTIATTQPNDNQGFTFLSAYPNPFTDKTELTFLLSKPSVLKITFYNAQGATLWQTNQLFQNEKNRIFFTKERLQHSGIIYYRIEGANIYHVGKLMRLEK